MPRPFRVSALLRTSALRRTLAILRMPALLVAITVSVSILSPTLARAQLYEITAGQFTQGCLPPCLCPILFVGELEGTFTLDFTGPDGSFDVYTLSDFDVDVINFLGDVIELSGNGEYRVDEVAGEHELTIEIIDVETGDVLSMNSGGPVEFAPGVVFPDIEIFVGTSLVCAGSHISFAASTAFEPEFVRGDCNDDGGVDISDAIESLTLLFVGGVTNCVNACDTNDDEGFDISDPIYSLAALFTSGPAPLAPYPNCGDDPTGGTLACTEFAACP